MPKNDLRDRVVVITGASSGLGRALEMVQRGASLVLAALRIEVLEDVARQCRAVGGSAIAVQTDVTVEADV